jgi:hypothetical protein
VRVGSGGGGMRVLSASEDGGEDAGSDEDPLPLLLGKDAGPEGKAASLAWAED